MLITMTVIAAFGALSLAVSVGYYFGRRAGSKRSTWQQRTSRVALGRRALNLVVLVAARRVRHRFRAEPMIELPLLRILAPVEVLRGSVTRMRSYRGAPGW